MPALLRTTVLAAALATTALPAFAEQSASLRPMTTVEALETLSARGLGELHAISAEGDGYRVVVRDGAGRLRDLRMDPATGALSPADTGGLYSNWFDPELLVRLRGSLAPDLPAGSRPAHELAAGLIRSGDYAALQELRFAEDVYRARVVDHSGQVAELALDPVSGAVMR